MKTKLLNIILFFLTLIATYINANAQFSVISNLENQNIGNWSYNQEENTITFATKIDSINTIGVWFNFGVTGFRKDTFLTFKSEFQSTVHSTKYPGVSINNTDFHTVRQKAIGKYFELSIFPYGDTIYIATGYPYTYTRLQNYLDNVCKSNIVKRETLYTTSNNLKMELVTITANNWKRHKNVIWIICRQHAFEVTSNFVLEGVINELVQNSNNRKMLRKNIFKIVPMVDVESVYNGQTGRMSKPVDYNRDWKSLIREEIKIIEQEIDKTSQNHKYKAFIDIHGTFPGGSDKLSAFGYFDIYDGAKNDLKKYWDKFTFLSNYKPRVIPDKFNDYEGLTADWWNEITYGKTLNYSFTLEVDWCVSPRGKPYYISDYQRIGECLIKAMSK